MVKNELLEKIVQKIEKAPANSWRRTKPSHETGSAYVLHDRGYRYILEQWQGRGCEIDIGGCNKDCNHREYDLTVFNAKDKQVIRSYYLDEGARTLISIYCAVEKEKERKCQQESEREEKRVEELQDTLLRDLKNA